MLGTEIEVISKINPFYPPSNSEVGTAIVFCLQVRKQVQNKKVKLHKDTYLGKRWRLDVNPGNLISVPCS